MPLVAMTELFQRAREGGYAVGYFEAWDTYSLEAVLEAAEAEASPVILGFGCMMVDMAWLDNGGVEVLGAIGRAVARARAGAGGAAAERGAHAGSGAARHRERLQRGDARHLGLGLGRRAGAGARADAGRPRARHRRRGRAWPPPRLRGRAVSTTPAPALTDPEQAARFVAETGVDCLAASIGNIHLLDGALRPGRPRPPGGDPRARAGAAGDPRRDELPARRGAARHRRRGGEVQRRDDPQARLFLGLRAVRRGAASELNVHATHRLAQRDGPGDAGKARMRAKVQELMRLYGSSGRATNSE